MTKLAATGLSVGYGGHAVLHDIDLELDAGVHWVLGANGAGKTTLFRALAGVLLPIAGRVRIDGRDPHEDISVKALVGVSAHRPALAPRLSVADNLYYWAHVLAVPTVEQRACVERVLSLLGLGPIAAQRGASLSRGQAQRVSLARALLRDPPVLLLDEPLSGVDPGIGAQLRDHLRALADAGHTLVVSTHELAEANEIGGDVTVLKGGRVVGHGGTSAVRSALVGESYRLRMRATGDLTGALSRLGYQGEASEDGSVVIEVPNEEAVESLVAGLAGAGVGIREVAHADNPLEELYLHFQNEEPTTDAH